MLFELDLTGQLALAAGCLVTIYLIHNAYKKKYRLPPGPYPLPVLGNLLSVGSKDYMHEHFTELGQKYGDICMVYMGPKRMVILNTIETIREAFLKKGVEFANRPATYSGELFGGDDGIVFAQYTPQMKLQRKISHSALRKFATGEALESLLRTGFADMCAIIDTEDGNPFDIYPKLSFMVYNILTSMVCGKRFEADDPFFKQLIEQIDSVNSKLGNGLIEDIYPIFKHFPNKLVSEIKVALKEMTDYFEKCLEEHEESFNEDEIADFVDLIISARKEVEREEGAETVSMLTKANYIAMLADMFFAGTDTSRFTLNWTIGLCTQHPEVQARMHKEINDAVGDSEIGMHHRSQLPYTEAVLHEALRMYPAGPLGVPRATSCDVTLRDYDLPQDTWVVPNIWACHRDPKEWDEPDKFKPERHLDENGQLAPKPNSFLPFSTGRRVCVGEAVAKAELHLLTAMIFQRYSFHPPPGEKIKLEVLPGLIMLPKTYQVVAIKRH